MPAPRYCKVCDDPIPEGRADVCSDKCAVAWNAIVYQGRSRAELTEAFDKVRDRKDWKEPIDAIILAEELGNCLAAIEYFTATVAEYHHFGDGTTRITADGYRAGPAGDH